MHKTQSRRYPCPNRGRATKGVCWNYHFTPGQSEVRVIAVAARGDPSLPVLWVSNIRLVRDTLKGLHTFSMVPAEKSLCSKTPLRFVNNYRLCNCLISLCDLFKSALWFLMFKIEMSRSGCGKQPPAEWHSSICCHQCPLDIDYYVLYYLDDKVHVVSGWTVISCIILAKKGKEKLACRLLDKWLLLSESLSSLRKARKRKPGERAGR